MLFQVSNNDFRGPASAVHIAIALPYSRRARSLVARVLVDSKPDVVHVHNFFPLLTPSILDACAEARVPVVHTLHNYRLLCANGLLLRDGRSLRTLHRGHALQRCALRLLQRLPAGQCSSGTDAGGPPEAPHVADQGRSLHRPRRRSARRCSSAADCRLTRSSSSPISFPSQQLWRPRLKPPTTPSFSAS